MHHKISIIILLCAFFNLNAQDFITSGKITNFENESLPNATIKVINNGNSISTISNNLGEFKVIIRDRENDSIKVSYVGYETLIGKLKEFLDEERVVIKLKKNSIILNEISISSEKEALKSYSDRFELNLDNLKIKNAPLDNILNYFPGIISEKNDLSLFGTSIKVILGERLLNLTGARLQNYLTNLSSANVEKITLYNFAPAIYNLDGPLLVIKFKKNESDGVFNLISLNIDKSQLYSQKINNNISFRRGNFYLNNQFNLSLKNENVNETNFIYYSNNNNTSFWNSNNFKLDKVMQMDFNPTLEYVKKKSIIFFSFEFSDTYKPDNLGTNLTTINALEQIQTINETKNFVKQISSDLVINTQIGPVLKLRGNFSTINSFQNKNQNIISFSNLLPNLFKYYGDKSQEFYINNMSLNLNYNKINLGIAYYSVENSNNITFNLYRKDIYNYINESQDIVENNFLLNCTYETSITKQSKLNIGIKLDKFDRSVTSQDSINYNNKFFISPILNFNTSLSSRLSYSTSIYRKIYKPEFYRLNSLAVYQNPFYLQNGNSQLLPSNLFSLEQKIIYLNNYVFQTFYRKYQNKFSIISTQDNINQTLSENQINIPNSIGYGMNIFVPFKIVKHLDTRASIQIERKTNELLSEKFECTNFNVRISSNYQINKNLILDGVFWWKSNDIEGSFMLSPRSSLNLGITKILNKPRISMSLRLNDIFYKDIYELKSIYKDQNNGFLEKQNTQKISFNLNFEFGNYKSNKKNESKTQTEDKDRL